MRPASGAVASLASVIVSTGAGSTTRASRSRSTATRCAGSRAGAASAKPTVVAGTPVATPDVTLVRERERHFDDAEAAAREPSGQLEHEPVHRERERLDACHRRRQVEFSRIARRRHERRPRLRDEAAHAIEEGDEIRADAPCQRGARQRARLPEGRDAGGGERCDGGGVGLGERERQRKKRVEPVAEIGSQRDPCLCPRQIARAGCPV